MHIFQKNLSKLYVGDIKSYYDIYDKVIGAP